SGWKPEPSSRSAPTRPRTTTLPRAGKSTLLKIVAGVIRPTRGNVVVRGRVGALLELGSGFHPEYTGLANIELAAALLGVPPEDIAAKRDDIVAFADLGEHIRDPIKHYS